jgi:pentapeptide repeat protein
MISAKSGGISPMANEKHLELLQQGIDVWNAWREKEHEVKPDLCEVNLSRVNLNRVNLRAADLKWADLNAADLKWADLSGADLLGAKLLGANLLDADLSGANLSGAYLDGARLYGANLSGANLSQVNLLGAKLLMANLNGADLTNVNLLGADLSGANLIAAELLGANLIRANLSGADLSEASLEMSALVETDLTSANLTGCHVYGISAWEIKLSEDTKQQNLVITPKGEAEITADDIEVAQFLYLMLRNEKIRNVIDAVVSKVVLILGRFSDAHKPVLDAIRADLRARNLVPVLFDFTKPANKDLTGTVETLARMARFIIADLTDPSSIPHELATIVPFLRTTPVLPLRLMGSSGYGMFKDLTAYPWVLPTHEYSDVQALLSEMGAVIAPAEERARVLRPVG